MYFTYLQPGTDVEALKKDVLFEKVLIISYEPASNSLCFVVPDEDTIEEVEMHPAVVQLFDDLPYFQDLIQEDYWKIKHNIHKMEYALQAAKLFRQGKLSAEDLDRALSNAGFPVIDFPQK